jgi:hypothetical protein
MRATATSVNELARMAGSYCCHSRPSDAVDGSATGVTHYNVWSPAGRAPTALYSELCV